MAHRMARRLEVRGRPPGRVDGRAGGNTGPRRVGQVGVVESRVHRTVPLARASALSRQRWWETESGRLLATFQGDEISNAASKRAEVNSAVFSPDGRWVLTSSDSEDDKTARLWEAESGKLLATFQGHTDLVWSAVFSPDGRRVLTESRDKTARLWEAQSGKLLATFQGHTDGPYEADFNQDGRRVVTVSFDGTARLAEAESGKLPAIFQGDEMSRGAAKPERFHVRSAVFSPDGRRVLTASYDNARLWEAESGKLLATFQGHTDSDGRRVLTASYDDARWFKSAVFSLDGRRVLTASEKTARLWETPP